MNTVTKTASPHQNACLSLNKHYRRQKKMSATMERKQKKSGRSKSSTKTNSLSRATSAQQRQTRVFKRLLYHNRPYAVYTADIWRIEMWADIKAGRFTYTSSFRMVKYTHQEQQQKKNPQRAWSSIYKKYKGHRRLTWDRFLHDERRPKKKRSANSSSAFLALKRSTCGLAHKRRLDSETAALLTFKIFKNFPQL